MYRIYTQIVYRLHFKDSQVKDRGQQDKDFQNSNIRKCLPLANASSQRIKMIT